MRRRETPTAPAAVVDNVIVGSAALDCHMTGSSHVARGIDAMFDEWYLSRGRQHAGDTDAAKGLMRRASRDGFSFCECIQVMKGR